MDVGSIISNALGGIIASLFVLLLVAMGKQIQAKRKQRARQPKEVLNKALLQSQEYQDILRSRKFYRIQGYGALIWLLSLITAIIIVWVINGTVRISFKDVGGTISIFGLLITLACFSPLALYLGYSPITSQEVEQKRQANRARTFKEALGARPYGYIFQSIAFPLLGWFFLICNMLGLILILAYPPSLVHIPMVWVTLGIGFAIVTGVYGTYMQVKWLYRGVKSLKNVPELRQSELRQQFTQDEFNNNS